MPATLEVGKFKYKVAVYLNSGFARFSVRVWRRSTAEGVEGSYAVEVMRECGDRILVTRFFEMLAATLQSPEREAEIKSLDETFTPAMFDWAPRKVPEDILARLPAPSDDAVAAGIDSMVGMVTSHYGDVSVSGCASVGKLAAASERTRLSMARSRELVAALLAATCSDQSLDTRSNAAMALLELLYAPTGEHNVSSTDFVQLLTTFRTVLVESGRWESVSDAELARLVGMETKAWVADIPEWNSVESAERYYLARYCAESLRELSKNPEFGAKFPESSKMSTVEESV
jgi:hypothetical protein